MPKKGPGKSFCKGLSVPQFFRMFPDNAAAECWFIEQRWPGEIGCPNCGSRDVKRAKHLGEGRGGKPIGG